MDEDLGPRNLDEDPGLGNLDEDLGLAVYNLGERQIVMIRVQNTPGWSMWGFYIRNCRLWVITYLMFGYLDLLRNALDVAKQLWLATESRV